MNIIEVAFQSEMYLKSLELRDKVLRKPLGLSIGDEVLDQEKSQIHLIAVDTKNAIIGVVVMVPNYLNTTAKLRQMATAKMIRGKGVGKSLVQALETKAKEMGQTRVVLHAREAALGFYLKLGYEVSSDVFFEVGIPHYKMSKSLNSSM